MKWLGSKIDKCNLCNRPIEDIFVDGRISCRSSWCIMCMSCFAEYGRGLGVGLGQAYEKVGEDWIKIV